jgi:hypothetical protein
VVIPGAGPDGNGGAGPDNRDTSRQTCEANTGYSNIAFLYYEMIMNPNKTDLTPLSAQCLVKIGYRDFGYTADDYKREFDNDWAMPTQVSFGNESTIPGANFVMQSSVTIDPQKQKDALNGKPSKDAISFYDFNKCAYNPNAALNEIK